MKAQSRVMKAHLGAKKAQPGVLEVEVHKGTLQNGTLQNGTLHNQYITERYITKRFIT